MRNFAAIDELIRNSEDGKAKNGNIIKKTNLCTVRRLKSELKIERNSSLILFLVRYLANEINNIDYSTDALEILELIRLLNCLKIESEKDYQLIEESLKNLKMLITAKKHMLVNSNDLLESLDEIEEKINSFLIGIRFEKSNQKIEAQEIDTSNKKVQSLVFDMIFKHSDIKHLNILLSLYPNIANIKYNNESIILMLFKNYYFEQNERVFLSKVIITFVTGQKFALSVEDSQEIVKLTSQYSNLLDESDLMFIDEILTLLGLKQNFNFEEDLVGLKKRYGLKESLLKRAYLKYSNCPVDMTDREIITIDCGGTIIRDDAISFRKKEDGTIELGIYITDLSAVKSGSKMDEYAINHFATIYLRDKWIPMFPEHVIRRFSLDKGKRRVVAFTYIFTSDFKLESCSIDDAIINVSKCLYYNDVENILTNGGDLYYILKNLADLAESIEDSLGTISRYHRLKNIARELGSPMSNVPEKYLDTYGSRIIASAAIFLNNYVANIFNEAKIPFIYRVNDYDNSTILKEIMNDYRRDRKILGILKSIQTVYKPSTFSTINTGHKGLGLIAYTQSTNPARSYPSLLVQRMIQDYLIDKLPLEEYMRRYQNLDEYAQMFNDMQKRNDSVVREYDKVYSKLRNK